MLSDEISNIQDEISTIQVEALLGYPVLFIRSVASDGYLIDLGALHT
jgi:hypothetical protein